MEKDRKRGLGFEEVEENSLLALHFLSLFSSLSKKKKKQIVW